MHPLYSVHPPPSSEVSAFHTAQMQTKNYVHASIPSQPENLPCITLFRNSKFRNFCDPLNPQGSDYDYAHETPAQVPHLTQSHPSATVPHRHLRNQHRAEPKPNPSPKTRATDPQKAGTLTPMGRDGEGRERACVVTSSTRMAAASSAPVMLTKVSIASCGGRAMAGGAPAPAAAWGAAAMQRRGGWGPVRRAGEERSREAAEPCVLIQVWGDVVLPFLIALLLPSRGPWAVSGGPARERQTPEMSPVPFANACVLPRWMSGSERRRGMGVKHHRQRLFYLLAKQGWMLL